MAVTSSVNPRIGIHNVSWIVHEDAVLQFRVNLTHGVSPLWNAWSEGNRPGFDCTDSGMEPCLPLNAYSLSRPVEVSMASIRTPLARTAMGVVARQARDLGYGVTAWTQNSALRRQ